MNTIQLTRQMAVDDFDRGYWLKQQLTDFCREHGLAASGSKRELTQRVRQFLLTGAAAVPIPWKRPQGRMPTEFRRDMVIGRGWRCSQALRAFFETEIGPHFHFNAIMRDFIGHGEGRTLQDAIDAWQQDQHLPQAETVIAPQFEYNRHIRHFFQQHPGAALADAIAAWNAQKAHRNTREGNESQ